MYSVEQSPPPQPTPPRPASQRGVIEPAGAGAREASPVHTFPERAEGRAPLGPARPHFPWSDLCPGPGAWFAMNDSSLQHSQTRNPQTLGIDEERTRALQPSFSPAPYGFRSELLSFLG